jgi:ParB-like chromosome segregation protein Spo0J
MMRWLTFSESSSANFVLMEQQIRIDDVIVGERFRKELGDIEALAQSIKELGLLQPIAVDEKGNLIAGHRRLEACKSLGWTDIPCHVVNLGEIVKGEYSENVERKAFTPSELVTIKRALEPELREQAKERMMAGTPSDDSAKGSTTERIGALVGVSRDTLAKAETIVEAAEKEPQKYEAVREAVDRKEISVNEGYRRVTGKQRKQKSPHPKDTVILPAELFETAIKEIQSAIENGMTQLILQHDGNQINGVGDTQIATT